ncbi:MAG TPA: monovalent cation/H(+) antiporter subunit G [Acidimicrobiales bacterium]
MARTIGDLLLLVGAGWIALAAVGVIRFDDVYSRMHAATKSPTLGLILVSWGAAMHLGGFGAVKLLLVGALVLLTAPVGAHLIGRAVHRSPGDVRIRIDTIDELGSGG